MTGIYAADGSFNVSVVDGSEAVPYYALDGSINVIVSDGSPAPLQHPCGAIRVTLTTDIVPGIYATDGSYYVSQDPYVSGSMKVTAVDGSFGAFIQLSNDTVPEGTSVLGDVGTLSVPGGSGSYTYTILDDPDTKFDISGDNLILLNLLDYETATEHSVTVQADNGADDPISHQFTIFVTDVVPPVLSNPIDTASGSAQADLTVTTDQADGTLYTVVTTSNTSPSAAQIKAGQDNLGAAAVFADSQSVASTGDKNFLVTGLTASTQYYSYFLHERLPTEQSNIAAADGFITDADVSENLPHFAVLF